MALVYMASSGIAVTTGADTFYQIKTFLKARGWTVPASSDGLTYNASGDQITSAASGAGGMDNNSAWFRLQDPAGVRERLFQRGTNNKNWRDKYSRASKFTGGSPGATTAPTAADQGHVQGADTPTFVTCLPTDGTYKLYGAADNAAPYGFCFLGLSSGLTALNFFLCYDPLASLPDASDLDPYVVGMNSATSNLTNIGAGTHFFSSSTGSGFSSWLDVGGGSAAFVKVGLPVHSIFDTGGSARNVTPGGDGTSHAGTYNGQGKYLILPAYYDRPSTNTVPVGTKGVSYWWRLATGPIAVGDTGVVGTSKDWVGVGTGLLFRWNGTTIS